MQQATLKLTSAIFQDLVLEESNEEGEGQTRVITVDLQSAPPVTCEHSKAQRGAFPSSPKEVKEEVRLKAAPSHDATLPRK